MDALGFGVLDNRFIGLGFQGLCHDCGFLDLALGFQVTDLGVQLGDVWCHPKEFSM